MAARHSSESPLSGKKARRKKRLVAVIDIGSNSVRLVVYKGVRRHPQILFNEKVLCQLGRAVSSTGRMDGEALAMAMSTLRRFRILCDDMKVGSITAVATAAARDAENGPEFIARIEEECGFRVRLLSGRKEARLSAFGVLSGIPGAHGIMGDMGGGSLEFVRLKHGTVGKRVSLPLGAVRLRGVNGHRWDDIRDQVAETLDAVGWLARGREQPFYLVGGAWRALMRRHIESQGWPIRVVQQYTVPPGTATELQRRIDQLPTPDLAAEFGVPLARAAALPIASHILTEVVGRVQPSALVASAFGLREGLLFDQLKAGDQEEDPLIAACKDIADRTGRFPEHADKLMDWIDPVFPDDTAEHRRLRFAACLLSDISWRGHPDFRAEKAYYEAIYGRFVGITHQERAFLALSLFICYGGEIASQYAGPAVGLLSDDQTAYARKVGEALRLGQRLTGGTSLPLEQTRLEIRGGSLELRLPGDQIDLGGDMVLRRLKVLAEDMRLTAAIKTI